MEKQTVFIKRYPSKGELPKTPDYYDTNVGRVFYVNERFDRPKKYYPSWFLEEIELPSEEEMQSEIYHESMESEHAYDFQQGAKHMQNFILNHLKSNTNG